MIDASDVVDLGTERGEPLGDRLPDFFGGDLDFRGVIGLAEDLTRRGGDRNLGGDHPLREGNLSRGTGSPSSSAGDLLEFLGLVSFCRVN